MKFFIKKAAARTIIGTILIFAAMPLLGASMSSLTIFKKMLPTVVNIALMNIIIAFAAALIAMVVWHRLRTMKYLLKRGF